MKTTTLSSTLLRAIFAMLFAVAGFLVGQEAYLRILTFHTAGSGVQILLDIAASVVGALLGIFLAPIAQSLFEEEARAVERSVERLAPSELVGGAAGLIVGLVIAYLTKSIFFEFVGVAGKTGSLIAILLYLVVAMFIAYLGARIGAKLRIVPLPPSLVSGLSPKVLDTSVIVDGRVVEAIKSGFLEGPFVLPRFVLRELQQIADSADALKRARGRRGLDVLGRLQEVAGLEVVDRDYPELAPGNVDAKLVRYAREFGAKIVTNDYNLQRVARVESVMTLNLHELTAALKPVVLPGEEMRVHVVREGKEPHQGVAYLDDGTMVVVERARRYLGDRLDVIVTSVLQTVSGRMIFARPKGEESEE
ncbi:MAG: TRAM domain-containing protein [Candidatus Eremiobacteraeota bacterium]|nr:TRAM domain-containing protein [Candidatus Eremiobacteraeota bacterium]